MRYKRKAKAKSVYASMALAKKRRRENNSTRNEFMRIWTEGIKGSNYAAMLYMKHSGKAWTAIKTGNHVAETIKGLKDEIKISNDIVNSALARKFIYEALVALKPDDVHFEHKLSHLKNRLTANANKLDVISIEFQAQMIRVNDLFARYGRAVELAYNAPLAI